MKIRLCQHNKGAEQRLQRLLAEFPSADCKLKKCAKQCKVCKKHPFALVDKRLVQADCEETVGQLLVDAIKQST